ncbi:MAG: GNAT family N-acetyltransferase [Solimonas sp.]
METLQYRYANFQDCKALAWFNLQLIRDGADTGPADPVELRKRFQRWLGSGRYRAVLFSSGGAMQAYALFREHTSEIYLRQFMVLPNARHHGVGRAAFELMRRRLWSPGKRLTVEALTSNPGGLAFWRAVGYRDCAITLEIDVQRSQPHAMPPLLSASGKVVSLRPQLASGASA